MSIERVYCGLFQAQHPWGSIGNRIGKKETLGCFLVPADLRLQGHREFWSWGSPAEGAKVVLEGWPVDPLIGQHCTLACLWEVSEMLDEVSR